MSDHDEIHGQVALSANGDDDEAIDLLGEEEADLDDELLDFDDGVVVQQFVPDEIDVGDTDRPEADIGADDLPVIDLLPSSLTEERLARVEEAARALAQAQVTREQGPHPAQGLGRVDRSGHDWLRSDPAPAHRGPRPHAGAGRDGLDRRGDPRRAGRGLVHPRAQAGRRPGAAGGGRFRLGFAGFAPVSACSKAWCKGR